MSLTLYVTLIVCSSLIESDGFKFAWRRPGVSNILKEEYIKEISRTGDQLDSALTNPPSQFNIKHSTKSLAAALLCPFLLCGGGVGSSSLSPVYADDELARYAAEGNKVGVDGQCFMRQCAIETATCANDPNCLKGLSCLARCKGGSLCSTGCFAKYGSDQLNELLSCSVERHDCVHVPGKDSAGWTTDKLTDLPSMPLRNFDIASLDGSWYKVMGLDTRYDCFDCQMNSFQVKDANTLKMEAMFRIPRPTKPGYMQNKIIEELHAAAAYRRSSTSPPGTMEPHLQSQGQMFGLTFWENWYVIGEAKPPPRGPLGIPAAQAGQSDVPDMKLVFYTGHTLQGSYKGAFLYSRSRDLSPAQMLVAADVIRGAGLDPNDFCKVRNTCFLQQQQGATTSATTTTTTVAAATSKGESSSISQASVGSLGDEEDIPDKEVPFWFLGQRFFKASRAVAQELADWFEDPTMVSDWLVSQQEKMVLQQPLEVSPFAGLERR